MFETVFVFSEHKIRKICSIVRHIWALSVILLARIFFFFNEGVDFIYEWWNFLQIQSANFDRVRRRCYWILDSFFIINASIIFKFLNVGEDVRVVDYTNTLWMDFGRCPFVFRRDLFELWSVWCNVSLLDRIEVLYLIEVYMTFVWSGTHFLYCYVNS